MQKSVCRAHIIRCHTLFGCPCQSQSPLRAPHTLQSVVQIQSPFGHHTHSSLQTLLRGSTHSSVSRTSEECTQTHQFQPTFSSSFLSVPHFIQYNKIKVRPSCYFQTRTLLKTLPNAHTRTLQKSQQTSLFAVLIFPLSH